MCRQMFAKTVYIYVDVHICRYVHQWGGTHVQADVCKSSVHICRYGVATISRLLKIIGLSCRISSLLQGSYTKETYNFKEPTNRSHPTCRLRGGTHARTDLVGKASKRNAYKLTYTYICKYIYVHTYIYNHIYTRREGGGNFRQARDMCPQQRYIGINIHAYMYNTYTYYMHLYTCTILHVIYICVHVCTCTIHTCTIHIHITCIYIHVHT